MTKPTWRASFLHFQEVADEVNSNVHFFKLHAPWPILCKYAEELNLRAPLQVNNNVWQILLNSCFMVVLYSRYEIQALYKKFFNIYIFWILGIFTFRLIQTPQSIGQSGLYLNCKNICEHQLHFSKIIFS